MFLKGENKMIAFNLIVIEYYCEKHNCDYDVKT